jgi:hypothetical protein
MASFDSDVLVDMGDFESSSSRSDEGTILEDAKGPSDGVYNYGCWHAHIGFVQLNKLDPSASQSIDHEMRVQDMLDKNASHSKFVQNLNKFQFV